MDCSTIIVSYNTFELTRAAVQSALDSGRTLRHEVIVVDNASPDNSYAKLQKAFPESDYSNVHITAGEKNRGFSAASNEGARRASGCILFFLNPDTFVHDDAIPRLVSLLNERPEIGAVGPRVLNTDGTDQYSVLPFTTIGELIRHRIPLTAILRRDSRRKDPIQAQSGQVDIVKGCALAIRRDVFNMVGGWDESYFMYSEEVELCWSLRSMGFSTYFLREAVITHHGGAATRERYVEHQLMTAQSTLKFLRRHGSPLLLITNRVTGLLGFGARAALFPLLAQLRPLESEEYRLRGRAAAALWRWYLFQYSE